MVHVALPKQHMNKFKPAQRSRLLLVNPNKFKRFCQESKFLIARSISVDLMERVVKVKFGYSEKATIFEKIFYIRFDVTE